MWEQIGPDPLTAREMYSNEYSHIDIRHIFPDVHRASHPKFLISLIVSNTRIKPLNPLHQ